ncbi:MAG TPA: molybdate ABC transporter permease subunit [Bacillota bacterium]|nr:molybdate ABC transporter permease subunit [Bacillota bacterium]
MEEVFVHLAPLFLSLKIAGLATSIVAILGIASARWMTQCDFPGKRIVDSLFMLPLVLPPTVIGFGLLYLFGKNGPFGRLLLQTLNVQVVFTWGGAVLAAVVVSFPLMYQSASAAFKKYDISVEYAALTMGASKWRVFWTISLPLAWPGILAGLVLTFARALGEFGATLMVAGYIPQQTETIPLAIYFAVETGDVKTASFWVMSIVIVGFTAVFWLNWWSARHIRDGSNKK